MTGVQTCALPIWVFAAIGAAETSLLGSVYADDPEAWKTLDLSEKQLAYFSHVLLNDPSSPQHGEGQTAADPTNMFDLYGGGSTAMAIWALAQGIGPSDEHPDLPDIGELFEYHGKERITVLDYIDGAYRGFHYSDEDDWTIPDQFRFHQDYVLTDTHLLPSPAQVGRPGRICLQRRRHGSHQTAAAGKARRDDQPDGG